MAIGTNRIRDLIPTDCPGRWGHGVNEVFGCTLYDLLGGAFTLVQVLAQRTSPTGVVTNEVVHDGAAFQGQWVHASSTYNAGTGVLTMFRVGGFAPGELLRFTVQGTDGVDDAYSTWYAGIGDPPGTAATPAVGDIVRYGGRLFRVDELVGAAGAVRYRCTPRDHTVAGCLLFEANALQVVPLRERLDARVVLSE